jgi:hypothetical protein
MPVVSGSSSFVSTPQSWHDEDDLFYDARSTQGSPPASSRSVRQPSNLAFALYDQRLHGDDTDYQLPPAMPVSRSLLRALSQGGEQVSHLCITLACCGPTRVRQLTCIVAVASRIHCTVAAAS